MESPDSDSNLSRSTIFCMQASIFMNLAGYQKDDGLR